MAALEVSDFWSSWKISHRMDQLEFTWRPSVPGRETRARRPLPAAGQLSGCKPDAQSRVSISAVCSLSVAKSQSECLMHEWMHLLSEGTREGHQGGDPPPLGSGPHSPCRASGHPDTMGYKVLLQKWGHCVPPEAAWLGVGTLEGVLLLSSCPFALPGPVESHPWHHWSLTPVHPLPSSPSPVLIPHALSASPCLLGVYALPKGPG